MESSFEEGGFEGALKAGLRHQKAGDCVTGSRWQRVDKDMCYHSRGGEGTETQQLHWKTKFVKMGAN